MVSMRKFASLVGAGGLVGAVLGYQSILPPGQIRMLMAPPDGGAILADQSPAAAANAPRPLSRFVSRGIAWLIAHQNPDGGWGQGEESNAMRGGSEGGQNMVELSNVADTCAAAIALIRTGNTPREGVHADAVNEAVSFVCRHVEDSDANSLSITSLQGTRLQAKLGTHVDTFLAALLLTEVSGKMADEPQNQRVAAALSKIMNKMQQNQQADGSWQNAGWAPVLAQGLAAKAVNRAVQLGIPVEERTRELAEQYAREQFDQRRGGFAVGGGAAGVELYAVAATLDAIRESDVTNRMLEDEARQTAESPAAAPAAREEAQQFLARADGNRLELAAAGEALRTRLNDERFKAGFGSNGGEEFLSYLSIGEAMHAQGGNDWIQWQEWANQNLSRIQNQDGSWSGEHCITGRTFCTASALMVLTVDRAAPLAGKVGRR